MKQLIATKTSRHQTAKVRLTPVHFGFIAILVFICQISAPHASHAGKPTVPWRLLGPGNADMVSSLNILPNGKVFAGIDIGGIYVSENQGTTWASLNNGLENYDITTQIIQDPIQKNVLYVGTRGGFYKSSDNGASWEAKRQGLPGVSDSAITAPVGALALHPDKAGILYLALGVRPDKQNINTLFYRKSWNGIIYWSQDRGETWEVLAETDTGAAFRSLTFSPVNPAEMFAATSLGALRSQDGGKSWHNIRSGDARDIACLPGGAALLLTVGDEGVFTSNDSGSTWSREDQGLPSEKDNNFSEIYLAPDHDKIYVLNSSWGGGGGMYARRLQEKNWRKLFHIPLITGNVPVAWFPPSRRVNAIAVHPANPHQIFLGTSRYLYRSDDGGDNWVQLISKEISPGKWTHTGINVFGGTIAVAVDPLTPERIYVGTADHGLVMSEDGGRSWFHATQGLTTASHIWDIKPDLTEPGKVIILASGKGKFWLAASTDYGKSWSKKSIGNDETLPLNSLLQEPSNPDNIFIAAKDNIFHSKDRGKSWQHFRNGFSKDLDVRQLTLHPVKSHVIYAATADGMYISEDSGRNWQLMQGTKSFNIYTTLADHGQPETLYAGTRKTQNSPGGLWKSTDGGKKWHKVLEASWISKLVQLPETEIFYALTNDQNYHDNSSGQGIFRSTNSGNDWEQVNDGLAVLRGQALTCSPRPPYQVYLGTGGSGVYVRTDQNMAAKDFSPSPTGKHP